MILLDTSIILAMIERKFDVLTYIDENYGKNKCFTISVVIDELKSKKKKGELALKLLDNKKILIEIYNGLKKGDDAILEYCENFKHILASEDKELLERAKNKHLKTLRIRSKSYLI